MRSQESDDVENEHSDVSGAEFVDPLLEELFQQENLNLRMFEDDESKLDRFKPKKGRL